MSLSPLTPERVTYLFGIINKLPESTKDDLEQTYSQTSTQDLVSKFNMDSFEFLDYLRLLSIKHKMVQVCKFQVHIKRLNDGKKAYPNLPIQVFCANILEHVEKIFQGDRDFFLDLPMNDNKVGKDEAGSNILNSQLFKTLWTSDIIDETVRQTIVTHVIDLTGIATEYFIRLFYDQLEEYSAQQQ